MTRLSTGVTFSILALVLSGCATHTIDRFHSFAEAGRAYSGAMVELTQEAGRAAIDADSGVLLLGRAGWSPAERESILVEHTRELERLLAALRDLRRHASLLEDYFTALSSLASGAGSAESAEEAGRLVTSLQSIGSRMETARIGEAAVGDFVAAAAPLSVAGSIQEALEDELQGHGDAVDRQIALQEAALEALTAETEADLDAILKHRAYTEVASRFIADGRLPAGWVEDRREVLSGYVTLASVQNAADAAGRLRETFRALVEGRTEAGDFDLLFSDIRAMIDLIELVRDNTEGGEE